MKTLNTSLLLFFVLLSSCSAFGPRVIDYSDSYVTGLGSEALTSEEIKINLSRSISMAGGNYKISVYPITISYINSLSRETSEVKGLRKKTSKQFKKKLYKRFLDNKVCLNLEILVTEFKEVSKLESWKLSLIDSNNIAYALAWLPESRSFSGLPATVTSMRSSYHGKEEIWSMVGQACAKAEVTMKKGFKVIFTPSFVQWPFPDEVTEEWSFNYTEIIKGKEVFRKKKERKVEGYRGW